MTLLYALVCRFSQSNRTAIESPPLTQARALSDIRDTSNLSLNKNALKLCLIQVIVVALRE